MNIAKLNEDRGLDRADEVKIIYQDRELTNREMIRQGRKLAYALANLGVRRGDRVIVQSFNCPEVFYAFSAAWRLGAVIVPINYMIGEEETAHIYRDSGAKVVITSKMFLPKVQACRAKAPDVQTVILIEDDAPEGTLSYRTLVEASPEETAIVDTADDDIAALIYTAGTTGKSKGVIHTHGTLYANAFMQHHTFPSTDGMTYISILPLCHSYGIASSNMSLFRSNRSVLLNTFDLTAIFSAIEKYSGNILAAVPTMYVYMLLYPEPKKYNLGSMKYWVCGSAPLAVETWNKFKDLYGFEISEGWGLTEAGANNSCNPLEGLKKVGSIGKPMTGTDMRIFDDSGEEVSPGEKGEIVIRGPQIMKGYWNRPGETAEVLKNGWLHTGDVGYVDGDGYFWITDRKKDLIIKGGENISPRTVEEVLYTHPKVSEAAVIGVKDERYGEDIKAFIVLHPGEKATAEEIVDFCRTRLSHFFLPRYVVFLEAMPKSLVGKILKTELRKL
ncbi:MAG: long-chain fatty acid--CoA ligase [Deltaproteobacteria bacterium]|nr:long-chain fatty acid--CoA ligase [Deltaproteobacteria bacterium]